MVHGIWGYHGDRAPQGDRLLSLRRHVPATTIVVDTPERIGAWFSIIDELTDQGGVVTSELVPAFHARGAWGEAGGLTLADRHARLTRAEFARTRGQRSRNARRYAVGVVASRRPKWVRSVVASQSRYARRRARPAGRSSPAGSGRRACADPAPTARAWSPSPGGSDGRSCAATCTPGAPAWPRPSGCVEPLERPGAGRLQRGARAGVIGDRAGHELGLAPVSVWGDHGPPGDAGRRVRRRGRGG